MVSILVELIGANSFLPHFQIGFYEITFMQHSPTPVAPQTASDVVEISAETLRHDAINAQKVDALWRELARTREKLHETERLLAQTQRDLQQITRLDELTGLPNYHAFVERMREEVRRASRFSLPLSIVLLDLDNLETVSRHTDVPRDAILCRVSTLLQKSTRAVDTVSRYGARQFGVILPNTMQDGAILLAERLCLGIEAERVGNGEESLSACFGVTTLTSDCHDGKTCIGEAYKAMRYSSMSGNHRVTHSQNAHIDRIVPWGEAPSVRLIEGSGGFSSIDFEDR